MSFLRLFQTKSKLLSTCVFLLNSGEAKRFSSSKIEANYIHSAIFFPENRKFLISCTFFSKIWCKKKQDGWLPSAYFPPSHIGKENFFIISFLHHILFFQLQTFSDLLPKKQLRCKRHFLKKNICFFQKNQNFGRFQTSYYFSRILRQICVNLAIKNNQAQKVSD